MTGQKIWCTVLLWVWCVSVTGCVLKQSPPSAISNGHPNLLWWLKTPQLNDDPGQESIMPASGPQSGFPPWLLHRRSEEFGHVHHYLSLISPLECEQQQTSTYVCAAGVWLKEHRAPSVNAREGFMGRMYCQSSPSAVWVRLMIVLDSKFPSHCSPMTYACLEWKQTFSFIQTQFSSPVWVCTQCPLLE